MTTSPVSSGFWSKVKPVITAPFYTQDLRAKQIKYIALAAIGLSLSIAACCVCPPLAVILSIAAGGASVWCSSTHFLDNAHARNQLEYSVKSVAFKVLGIFSKKYKDLGAELARQAPFTHPQSTAKKIINWVLTVAALSLWIASYFVAPQLGLIFNAVYAGIGLAQWTDCSYNLFHYHKNANSSQNV